MYKKEYANYKQSSRSDKKCKRIIKQFIATGNPQIIVHLYEKFILN